MLQSDLFGNDFRHASMRVGFEPLRRADEGRVADQMRRRPAQHRAAAVRWDGANDERGAIESAFQIVGHKHRSGQGDVRQVDVVGPVRAHLVCQRRIARPESHIVADSAEVHGQCGAPASGSQHGNAGRHQARAPRRRSVPERSLARFPRCLKRISTEAAPAAASDASVCPVA